MNNPVDKVPKPALHPFKSKMPYQKASVLKNIPILGRNF